MPLRFFIKTSFDEAKCFLFCFEGLQLQNVLLILFLFSMEHSYLLTTKITHDINSSPSIFKWCEKAAVGDSLHARQEISLN